MRYSEAFKMQVISELEKALANTQVRAVLNEAYYQIVCEDHGITDPDEYKRKTRQRVVDSSLAMKKDHRNINVSSLCRAVGMSRNNCYKGIKARERKKVEKGLIVDLVKQDGRFIRVWAGESCLAS